MFEFILNTRLGKVLGKQCDTKALVFLFRFCHIDLFLYCHVFSYKCFYYYFEQVNVD